MNKLFVSVLLAISLHLLSTGNASAQHYVAVRPVKPSADTRAPAPGPDYVWIHEEWKWEHGRYVWSGGYWALPPYRGASWINGYWKRGHEGWTWVMGHWAKTG
jgi:hypothetical protein